MKEEFKDQNEKCDFCEEPAIFKVKNSDNDWSISCEKHKKDALESLEKKCSCGHLEKFHNQIDGCIYQYPLDSNADYKDNQGICVCTEFVETKSITCDVCNNSFDYQVWSDVKGDVRPADELPDGYLIFGKWICQDCGSCSECGASLEKEGNMTEHKEGKLCRDCKIFTIDFFSCFCTAQNLEEAKIKFQTVLNQVSKSLQERANIIKASEQNSDYAKNVYELEFNSYKTDNVKEISTKFLIHLGLAIEHPYKERIEITTTLQNYDDCNYTLNGIKLCDNDIWEEKQ